jgi:dipeptidyl aminopeptidase/acylaminoacyl peptidase
VGRLELTGPQVAVVADVEGGPGSGSANFEVDRSGTLLYRTGASSMERVLTWVDAEGKKELLPLAPAEFRAEQLSRDHKRVALALPGDTLAIYDIARKLLRRLATAPGINDSWLVWDRSSRYLFYHTDTGIFGVPEDGSREPKRLTQGVNDYPKDLSPDGKQLYFDKNGSFLTLALDWTDPLQPNPGEAAPIPNIEKPAPVSDLKISPDGRWVAYISDVSGRTEAYVRQRAATTGAKWQISTNNAAAVQWAPNGHELLYAAGGAGIFVVPYTATTDAFVPGAPRAWPTPGRDVAMRGFSTDGKRLLVVEPAVNGKGMNHMVLLLHFADEVKRRVPGR